MVMIRNYVIGNVISIDGLKITALMNEYSRMETLHYEGNIYKGVSVGGYVGVIRGSNRIIGQIEKEFLEDKRNQPNNQEYLKERFERQIEINLVGVICEGRFEFGVKKFPMIFDEVVLLTDREISGILQRNINLEKRTIRIGKSVLHDIPIDLGWEDLFNTHIGIFGNTGSGKSNTLTKLYTSLFDLEFPSGNLKNICERSKFFILDFNGEYLQDGVLRCKKKCLKLSTRSDKGDRLPLTPETFWDIETLSILYSATEKTQRPFLAKAINYFLDEDKCDITVEKIIEGLGSDFYNTFKQNNSKELLNLLHKSLEIINFDTYDEYRDEAGEVLDVSWLNCLWHSQRGTYYLGECYINSRENREIKDKRNVFKQVLSQDKIKEKIKTLNVTGKVKIAVNSQLIYCLAYGKVNFEHINPLVQRIEARSDFVENTVRVSCEPNEWDVLNIISLRECNSDAKKMIPLLVAKQLYEEHKQKVGNAISILFTVHLIIDEAHNILSTQSSREAESWKDYRLEVFEEIIKEGRKFGFFLTVASQRPYDISPTIMSQIHNYFIHRLVNEQDLRMIANTVNSLDSLSRARIPNLAPGQCVITGTSFEMPLLVQVEKLSENKSPSSENVDLGRLWTDI
jgi:hypothetical protein